MGIFAPIAWNLAGFCRNFLDLLQFLDRLVRAGDVGEGRLGRVLGDQLGLRLAEVHHAGAAPCIWLRIRKKNRAMMMYGMKDSSRLQTELLDGMATV